MKYTITLRTSTDWGLTNWKAALQEKPWGSGGQVEHETGCALVVKKVNSISGCVNHEND